MPGRYEGVFFVIMRIKILVFILFRIAGEFFLCVIWCDNDKEKLITNSTIASCETMSYWSIDLLLLWLLRISFLVDFRWVGFKR